MTNLQAFQQRLDPLDYYNGTTPVAAIVSGDNQESPPGSFLPLPLVVRVTGAADQPLANAPVTFTVTSGGGVLAAAPGSATAPELTLRTAANGTVPVSYLQPNAPAVTSQVTASAGSPAVRSDVIFTALTEESQLSNTLTVAPESVEAVVNAGQTSTIPMTVTNGTAQPLQFTATVENGTFRGSYSYRDSDQAGGPVFVWNDISATGTRLNRVSDDYEGTDAVDLSFTFVFFGQAYQKAYVNSNGFITLGQAEGDWNDYFLPSEDAPANEIAAFHDVLWTYRPEGGDGDIYFQDFGDHAIIQFSHVQHWYQDGFVTFQIVLQRDGTILFYYKEMTGTLDQATVGIQNGSKDQGLTIASDQPYAKDNLAVRITDVVPWATVSPGSGSLASGESATLALLLDAQELENGAYNGGVVRISAGASPELNLALPVKLFGSVPSWSASMPSSNPSPSLSGFARFQILRLLTAPTT